jgi:hypothetical protein
MSTEYFIQQQAQYMFYSAAHGTFSKTDHILGHKARISKYKKTEITHCILSDHNAIKLELNNKSKRKKYTNNWRLNNKLRSDQWDIEEIRGVGSKMVARGRKQKVCIH